MERRDLFLVQSATATQVGAFLLLMAALLLPDGAIYFYGIAALAVLWFPTSRFFRSPSANAIRILFLLLACGLLVFSEQLYTTLDVNPSMECAVSLPIAWLICLLCIPEGGIIGFPLALLSCISVSATVGPVHPGQNGYLGGSALLLLISGALYFVGSLNNQRRGHSMIARSSVWRFSPHLIVTLFSVSMMMLSVDWVRSHVGVIARYLPDSSDHREVCNLQGDAPKFKDNVIAKVYSTRGELPTYMAERFFVRYEKGTWLYGQSCHADPSSYGHSVTDFGSRSAQARCAVQMQDGKIPPLVPFGAVRHELIQKKPKDAAAAPPASVGSGIRNVSFEWDVKMKITTSQKPTAEETRTYNLSQLERRAQDLCRQAENDFAKTVIVAGYLRNNTVYDARSPFRSAKGLDPAEAFIFETRKGWCVHYATATALMLRAAGVPTRFVTGFMITGNIGSRAFDILDRYGHAWCEALVQTADGPRWIVVDPSTRPQSPPAVSLKKLKMFVGFGLIAAILLLLVRTRMRVSVKDLKREIEEEKANTEAEHVVAVYNRILRYFERMGLYRAKFQTPREFARLVPASQQNDVMLVTRAFEYAKYMGWTTFGELLSEVDNAQARILGLKRGKFGRAGRDS